MTAAQKKAQDNFKKAIAYRKKTGCTLKQAFAHVKSGKVSGLDKVIKKRSKTTVLYTKKAKKKAAPKKKASQGVLFGIKKKVTKKPSEKAILKKVHSAKTTSKTLFNKLDKLDEAQHKHMGNINKQLLNDYNVTITKINKITNRLLYLRENQKKVKNNKVMFKLGENEMKILRKYLLELNTHERELRKLL